MWIVLDEVDGSVYGDIIISQNEMQRMKFGEMVDGRCLFGFKKYYLGVRLQGASDEKEDQIAAENTPDYD